LKRMINVVSKWMVCAGLCFLSLNLTACSTPDAVSGQGVWNMYSIHDDVNLGRQTIQANIKQMQQNGVAINRDAYRVAQLNEMTRRIARVSDLPQLAYRVTLFHTNIVNAAAAPGGEMMVFEGLYNNQTGLVHNDNELAAVLAHEIAHVNCRHSTEQLTRMMLAGMLVETTAVVLEQNEENDWADAIRATFAVGTALYVPIHSRKDEYEADRVGLFYMARAGYDPRAASQIWKRVAQRKGRANHSASIFATHPSNWDRYRALEKMMPYAMQEYAKEKGGYPQDYYPPPNLPPFDWRKPL